MMYWLGALADRRQLRLHGGPRLSGTSRRFTGLTIMPELLHGPVKPLQPKRLAVEEQYGVVVLVVLAASLEGHIRFPQLVILKFHRNPIFLRFLERPRLRLVNRRRFKFVCDQFQNRKEN